MPVEIEFGIEDPTSDDARRCIQSYFDELDHRFDTGFDPAVARSIDVTEMTEPAGLLLVARLDGRPAGCVALKLHADRPGEIKRMWVSPDARGLGLGRRLLTEVERHARDRGCDRVQLDTNASLTEAINLYRSMDYYEVEPFNDEPYAHHWFEKQL